VTSASVTRDEGGDATLLPTSPTPVPRLAPGWFELDLQVAGSLRGWVPQSYPSLDVSTKLYGTWLVDLRMNIANVFRVHRAYYESNAVASPRGRLSSLVDDAEDVADQLAWLIGMVGVPVGQHWEPIVRYEARAFESVVTPNQPIRFVPFDASADADLESFPLSRNRLAAVTSFETLVLGVRIDVEGTDTAVANRSAEGAPPFYVGGGLTAFGKPYIVRVGDAYVDQMYYDARFLGGGLALGTARAPTPGRLYYDLAMQIGAGDVSLTRDFDLSDTLPADWTVGYVQGNASFGYFDTLVEGPPNLVLGASGNVGGNWFFFAPVDDGDSSAASEPSTEALTLNWDVIWSLQANASMTF
jgi:hypothetical protein